MHSILLLSGNAETMGQLRSILGGMYRLFEAEDTPNAIKVLSSMPVDVVLIDSVLKTGNGIDGMRRVGEVFPEVPLIFIGPGPKSSQNQQAKTMGAFGSAYHPIDEENLLFMIEKAVEKQRLVRDLGHLKSTRKGTIPGPLPASGDGSDRRVTAYHTEVIRKLSKVITSVDDLEGLVLRLGDSVNEIFGATTTLLFVKDPITERYEPAYSSGVDRALFKDVWFDNEHGIALSLSENNQIMREETIDSFSYQDDYETARDLKILKAALIAPLSSHGELLGFISIGKRLNGLPYCGEDIELLALISVYTGIALRNAFDYQRIAYAKVCSESILRNIRTGIIAMDTKAKVTSINPFAEKLLGLNAKSIIGADVQKVGRVMADLMGNTLKSHSLYVHHEVRDPGSRATISVNTSLLRDEVGEIMGVIAFFTDLSEIKELQSKIEDLKKSEFWSELSARMAHEIRNPLTSIKTFTQIFRERYDDPEFRENFVEIVGKEVDKISNITDQLVAYSEPLRGDIRPVEINGLLDETIRDLSETMKAKGISIRRETGPEVVRARASRDMLKEAFLRVLQNAIDFTKEGGEITVSTNVITLFELTQREPASVISNTIPTDVDGELLESTYYVEIGFKDKGPGIPKEDLEKVFTPFFSTKIKGIGLGLAIAEKTLQQHRGRIELDSQVGTGTTVRLFIPAYYES